MAARKLLRRELVSSRLERYAPGLRMMEGPPWTMLLPEEEFKLAWLFYGDGGTCGCGCIIKSRLERLVQFAEDGGALRIGERFEEHVDWMRNLPRRDD